MTKVYVTCKARPFQPEMFMDVYGSKKAATKALRTEFPHMRPMVGDPDCFMSDKDSTWILFIHEREVQ